MFYKKFVINYGPVRMIFNETHISTKQIEAGQEPRFLEPHEHPGRPQDLETPPD
jgi:hypothetical protein